MPKSGLSSEQLRIKFSAVTNSQDSIQTTSQWILGNKNHIGEIIDSWEAATIKSDHEHRLTLLYLANDVVQNCRRKNPALLSRSFSFIQARFDWMFVAQWQERMEIVFKHLTHHSIRPQVEKVVNVLDSRAVFPKDSITRIRESLQTAKELHKGTKLFSIVYLTFYPRKV